MTFQSCCHAPRGNTDMSLSSATLNCSSLPLPHRGSVRQLPSCASKELQIGCPPRAGTSLRPPRCFVLGQSKVLIQDSLPISGVVILTTAFPAHLFPLCLWASAGALYHFLFQIQNMNNQNKFIKVISVLISAISFFHIYKINPACIYQVNRSS